jgi:hypothetical protein
VFVTGSKHGGGRRPWRRVRARPPSRPSRPASAGAGQAVSPAPAGRRRRRPPLASRPPLARLSPPSGRYRPASSPRWHQPNIKGALS